MSIRKKQNFGNSRLKFSNRRGNAPQRGRGRAFSARKRGFSEQIDVSLFVKKAVNIEPEKQNISSRSFYDFSLCKELQENLRKRNFASPTPIQDQAIPHILSGSDLVGLANTGTGKTAAFLLPLINKVANNKSQKVLIIAPTRELAQQIEKEFRQFSWGMKIFSAICVGGSPIYKQINNLRRDPNFVIGTPGRLDDLEKRGLIHFHTFQNIVLDEVDRMLDMGFVDTIKSIMEKMPENRQSLFFSATLPQKIKDLISRFLGSPIIIDIKSAQPGQNVDQDIVRVRDKEMKFYQLQEILRAESSKKVLIFIETKAEVEKLTRGLISGGFKADSIHGDKKQHQRQRALSAFRNNMIDILVATDVAARGLDIDNISHVINYTIPQTYDDYVHRIGRTGRSNKSGCALTFVE